jgi:hypothetical protein
VALVTAKRRYTRKTKANAVMAAALSSVQAAAEDQGIPRTTVQYWFDSPEFVTIRQKTREELAAEATGMAHKVLVNINQRMAEFEPRDLSILLGILVDKGQLLAGAATARVEARDITGVLDDHETEALRDWIDGLVEVVVE